MATLTKDENRAVLPTIQIALQVLAKRRGTCDNRLLERTIATLLASIISETPALHPR